MKRPRLFASAERAERELAMVNMWIEGKTYDEIAAYFGMSKSRVRTIVNREANVDYICNKGSKTFVPCCHFSK